MSEHLCSSCKRGLMTRSERRSFLERYIYPMVGLYPWRCKFCRNREKLRDRGERRPYTRRRRTPETVIAQHRHDNA